MTDTSKRRLKWWVMTCLVLLAGVAAFRHWHRVNYPYGSGHCCNKALSFMLIGYAAEHGGRFPDAGGSAASLALLAKDSAPWDLLVGKGGSADAAEKHFQAHGTLPDEFSTWHYVPGLSRESGPNLALFWDKTGLTHNGKRQSPIKYEVCYVSGMCSLVDERKWPAFLEEQQKLLEEDRKRHANAD